MLGLLAGASEVLGGGGGGSPLGAMGFDASVTSSASSPTQNTQTQTTGSMSVGGGGTSWWLLVGIGVVAGIILKELL